MSKSIGIDLGTTNSVAAVKTVAVEVIKNAEGERITPSCVALKPGGLFGKPRFVVGRHALEWLKQDPAGTVVAVKRLMGRSFADPEVRDIVAKNRLRYRIQQHSNGTENSLAVLLADREFTPEELSAEILKKVRADAEAALGDTAGFAVITVPAYFNDKQKHATRAAATLAGLKVRRLLSEPTAAAIAFGVDQVQGEEARTVLVFDFGGGTLDLSVLTISGGQFIEQGKGGDMWLGGEDIDGLLMDHVLAETARESGKANLLELIEAQDEKRKIRFLGELKEAVEAAKIRLSSEEKAAVELLGLLRGPNGELVDVDVEISRARFEALLAPVVQAALRHVRELLDKIHFTPELIDQVLLVGGSSCIPCLARALGSEFGPGKVRVHDRPLLAVAEGAAILSHRLADSYECPGCGGAVLQADKACGGCGFDLEKHTIQTGVLEVVHASAHDYCIRLEDGSLHELVRRNAPLPCAGQEVFKLLHPEQRLVHMKFFNRVNDKEESIGDLWLGVEIPEAEPDPGAPLSVEIGITVDENNLAEVSAAVRERPAIRLSRTLSRGKADEKLLVALEAVLEEAQREKYGTFQAMDLTQRALSVIADAHRVLDPETDQVNEALLRDAESKLEKARRMAREGHSTPGLINYAEEALIFFGPILSPRTRESVRKKIARLQEMDAGGSYEENVRALRDLDKALDKQLGGLNALMEIRKAASYCSRSDPAKAPRFANAIREIMEAVAGGDRPKAEALLDSILPEAQEIVCAHDHVPGVIHKGITR